MRYTVCREADHPSSDRLHVHPSFPPRRAQCISAWQVPMALR
jgi:hypothetical protein